MPEMPVVHPDKAALSAAVGARLLTAILDAQAERGVAQLVLTGGSMGAASLAALRTQPGASAIDWARVDLWWGDERVLPGGDPERNEVQAREALIDHVPVDPARVHVMAPAPVGATADAEQAASDYAAELGRAGYGTGDAPFFDVVMLGVGPDGHVASLFPGHPQQQAAGLVVAVHDSPKPPPTRVSLTFEALRNTRQVWFLVSGNDKAEAVRLGLDGADPERSSAAQVRGREATCWLVDAAAAGVTG
ncbi:6-phosphogluconolactonase [Kribbia dieselivorans]|uniref:6-phosphogluconolactonase n=1 Tax=Kribbia dieselivorans TaxID=331526 RepID=UPI00083885F7|nr:6-phosphogluconolactonase [Kribbia dieselivorans]